ncbi:Spy/CpxP family protein refolding chaperone, partial [Phenylobacterium sp.]|uniref:Spy/CpxP family protein refolding chaperone n=1 Tax=Phenylobacterium sp. TaxID=1871053 RepID=UPI002F421B62
MTRPLMGYLAGAAFVLSTVGAAAAYAQASGSASAQLAQSQATADSHASASVQMDHGDRDAERVQRDKERTADRLERQQERVKEQHERIERVEMRHGEDAAQHLRTMLQLKPGQEAALQAYMAAMHPAHHGEQIVEMSSHGEARTTTQKLADMEKRLVDQNAQAKARIDATRRFYDQLDSSQKKVFDE